MRKISLVASVTYRQRLRSAMFLLLTFGLPLLMVVAGALPILTASDGELPPQIGVVDETGNLLPEWEITVTEAMLDIDEQVRFAPFPTRAAAREAVQEGRTGAYLLIPQGYFDGEPVTYFADEAPGTVVEEALQIFLQRALLQEPAPWLVERLQTPAVYTYSSLSGEQVSEGQGLLIRLLVPVALAIVFSLAVFVNASQMGSVIVQEKDSRAMEIVVTSLQPRQLVAGKILGMTLLSLTQIVIWIAAAILAAILAFDIDLELAMGVIPWSSVLWGVALILPAYFLFALLAAGLGIIAGTSEQARQLASILGLAALAPLWVLALLLNDPGGAPAVGLTLFPLTAPTVALMRMTIADVPPWQLAASLSILLIALLAALLLVTKVFRAAMLSYGQTLEPRQIWRALRRA